MDSIVMLCTDGSDVSIDALRSSLPLLAPADRTVVVTVESPVDPAHSTGRGFSTRSGSGPGSGSGSDAPIETDGDRLAKQILDRTAAALGLVDVELMAIVGSPGAAICEVAAALPASVVVIGTSGKGGLRRAVLGSTSDYVVRHAVCPVMVQGVGQH
jgi:nucleotide-binding universal stress UspA family protein